MRWGVMGTGGVAHAFAEALRDVPDAQLAAVGSRSLVRAELFAERHSVVHVHQSYEGLADCDAGLDAIYIATPASHHYVHTMLALKAGKHVLCEKPFATNATDAHAMFNVAQNQGLLVMEAMWPRFLPSWSTIRDLATRIGEVRAIEASFGGRAAYRPTDRPFRLELGGGALLDAAVYPISFAEMILGSFSEVHAAAKLIPPAGVDEQVAVMLRTETGQVVTCLAGITTTFKADATIYGTEGMIVIPGNFTNPPWVEVHRPGREPEHYDFPASKHRLAHQVEEFQKHVGDTEGYLMPRSATCEVMRILDEARAQIGLPPVPEVQ